jgi:hypothetical protein
MLSMSDKDLERTLWPERTYERLLVMLGSRSNGLFKVRDKLLDLIYDRRLTAHGM